MSADSIRVSVTVTDHSYDLAGGPLHRRLADVAQAADTADVDTLWVADHLLQAAPGRTIDEPMLEAFTTLGYLAHGTTRVRLGTMVAAATYRAPALLIKAITTLDVLSGGRAWLGIGAGYQADEAGAMGLDLPPVPERFERLEETLRLAMGMFDGDATAFVGEHYRLACPVNNPPPVTRPRPPILVGGAGERHTLRLVARYADACNVFDLPDDGATIRRKFDVLRRHCDAIGRDYDTIDRTVSTRWAADATVDGLAAHCARLAGYGVTHVVLLRPTPWTPDDVMALSRVTADPPTVRA